MDNKNSMSASMWYYGCEFSEWADLKYFDAIQKRVDCAKELYHDLLKKEQRNQFQLSFEERKRLWKVEKALRDNQKLLNERDCIV